MQVLGIVLVSAGIMALFIWLAIRQQRRALALLAGVAARQGLRLGGAADSMLTKQELAGQQHGRRVRFWTYSTGSGKSRRTWIAAGVEPRRAGLFTFELQPQGMFAKLSEFFGAKEIQVGDRAFDEQWFVRTSMPEEFRAALLPEIRGKFIAAHAAGARGKFKLEEGWVCYTEQGGFASEPAVRRLEGLLPLLHELADIAEVCAGPGR
jgi:hypothetical protein